MQIQNNLINEAFRVNVDKFIFLGSSYIYPKLAPQLLKEEYLLTASLESNNEWHTLTKTTGVKLCEATRKQFKKDYVNLMPTELYGSHDNYDLNTSHALPAIIRRLLKVKLKNNETVFL